MKPATSAIWLIYLLVNCDISAFLVDARKLDGAAGILKAPCISRDSGTKPPVAHKRPALLTTAAGAVVDEYHWLRDDTHQDPRVLGYLAAENAYSDAVFQQLQPLAAQLAREMEGRLGQVTAPLPVRHGQWWYYERHDLQQRSWVSYRRRVVQETLADGALQEQDYEPAWVTSASSSRNRDDSEEAAEEVVLDPNFECEQHILSGHSRQGEADSCEVLGSTTSPDGKLVAYGTDSSGSEQYQLMVRQIGSNKAMLAAPVQDTNGDYVWAHDSRSLFYVTRSNTTNRPDQVWFMRLAQPDRPILLWQESNPAFYLSISTSSSGRFLLLSVASEVTRQVLLLDLLKCPKPSLADWLEMAPRQQGMQQQQVGHWQDWLFLLLVSPDTPNGELRAARISKPHEHMVLLAHRREVELEDMRIFAHHLVLQERQLGHTTITVYCLPANSSKAAQAVCRYNSTAASAAEALADARAEQQQDALDVQEEEQAVVDARQDVEEPDHGDGSDHLEAAEVDLDDPMQLMNALPLLESTMAAAVGDVHHQSGTFVTIRGRAGSTTDDREDSLHLMDPAVAVEEQQRQQKQLTDVTSQKAHSQGGKQQKHSQVEVSEQHPPKQPADSQQHEQSTAAARLSSPPVKQAAKLANASSSTQKVSKVSTQPPELSADNSWQVAFEEDSYSVSIMETGDWSHPVLRLSYTSFTTPQSIIDIDMFTQRRVVRSVADVGGGFVSEAYRSYRLWVPAYDGVEVPLSLVYRLDSFGRNGLNPALLMVYGAYGTKFDPEFDSRLISLLDRGWLVGIAHVRGGGELGYRWHDDGRLEHKTNSFNDLLACAQALISHNMTSPSRLAVWGRSAGALTAAAAVNAAPELFQAAVMDVPFLDVVGDLVDAELPLTVKEWEEWGNPRVNATLAALIASYSPVHNVDLQAVYPHMIITAGMQDTRVGYWEAAKWVAQLRAAAAAGTAKQRQQLLLLRTDPSGGHVSAGASSSIGEAAVKYAFLIGTLPSCGSPQGLTGPDMLQQTPSALAAARSAASELSSMVMRAVASLQLLPGAVQKLMMLLMAVGAAAAALTVVWHASRVWLPAALNPADVAAALDSAMEAGSPRETSSIAVNIKSSPGGSAATSREMSRRVSTAAVTAASSERQLLLSKQKRSSTSGSSELTAPVKQSSRLSSSGGSGGIIVGRSGPAGSASAGLFSPSWGHQQHQLLFGGFVDDFLVDLTSGVPSSNRPGHSSHHRLLDNHSWHSTAMGHKH